MARVPEITRSTRISQVAAQPAPRGVGWGALAQLAKAGEDFVRPQALEDATVAGAQSVYRDESGRLQIDARNVLGGELSDAHNSAAYAKYLSQRTIDIRNTMTELSAQFQFDPAGFRQAAGAYVDTLRSETDVPELLREEIAGAAEREAGQRFNGLYVAEVDRVNREADRDTAAHRDMLTDDYVNLMMSGDTEGAAAVMREIEGITQFRTNAPFISETPAEAEALLRGTRGAARAAQLTRQLESLQNADEAPPEVRAEIQRILDDPDISPQTRMRLYTATEGVLAGIDGRAVARALAEDTPQAAANAYRASSGSVSGFVTPGYLAAIRQAESGGNDAAANPRSTALGRYQFIQSTWDQLRRNHPELGLTADGRLDPLQQELAIRAFTEDNARSLLAAGIEPSPGNLYAAHFLGAGGARTALRANPAAAMSDVVPPGVVSANPFLRNMTVADFQAWTRRKAGEGTSPEIAPAADAAAPLADAGIDPTPGSQFFAGVFGLDATSALYGADPGMMASDVLPAEIIEGNPALSNMTVQQAQMWADRRAVVKASDMAARRAEIDLIPNADVRDAALSSLNDLIAQRQRMESASAAEYEARLEAQDPSLSEMEVAQDHSLSDQAQNEIINELRSQRGETIAVANTVANLNDPAFQWNAYDTGQRRDVNDAYVANLNGESPMSQNGMTQAALIAQRTGFVPERMFDALRSAVNGNDPAALAQAMEFGANLIERSPNAFGPYGGKSDITGALSDYRFLSQFMDATAAAARMIENNSPEAVANRERISATDARSVAEDTIKIDDVKDHLSRLGVSTSIPDAPDAQGAIMDDYSRLFADAYRATGDRNLARNRALDDLSRVYGPVGVNGSDRLMRYPPAAFAPTRNGSHDWMGASLTRDVNALVAPDEPGMADPRARLLGLGGNRVRAQDIMLTSDAATARDIAAGRPPSYRVTYVDPDGVIEVMPQRYVFDAPPVEEEPILRMSQEQFDTRRAYDLGRDYMAANPGQFNPATEIGRMELEQQNIANNQDMN